MPGFSFLFFIKPNTDDKGDRLKCLIIDTVVYCTACPHPIETYDISVQKNLFSIVSFNVGEGELTYHSNFDHSAAYLLLPDGSPGYISDRYKCFRIYN